MKDLFRPFVAVFALLTFVWGVTLPAFLAEPVHAQGDPRFASFQKEIDPMLIPAVAASVPGISSTVYVNEITLTNRSGSDVTCAILDQQGSPLELFSGTVLKNSVYVMDFKGRKMPNGITWSCSSGTAVVGYVQYSTGRY